MRSDEVMWQYLWSRASRVWGAAILDWGKHSCFKIIRQTSKEIKVDISIFLGYSVWCCHIVKHLWCKLAPVLIFIFHLFILLSMTLIVNFVLSSYDTPYLTSWPYWEWTFYTNRNPRMKCFLQLHTRAYKTITLKSIYTTFIQIYTASTILYNHGGSKAVQV